MRFRTARAQGRRAERPSPEGCQRTRLMVWAGPRPRHDRGNVFSSKDPMGMTDNWAGLLASGFAYWLRLPAKWSGGVGRPFFVRSGIRSVRPRLQRRDRNGLAPFSLFFPRTPSRETPLSTRHATARRPIVNRATHGILLNAR